MTAYDLKEKIAEMIEEAGFNRYLIAIEDTEMNTTVSTAKYCTESGNLIKQANEVFLNDSTWHGTITTTEE